MDSLYFALKIIIQKCKILIELTTSVWLTHPGLYSLMSRGHFKFVTISMCLCYVIKA